MKILALEKEVPGTTAAAFQSHVRAEAARIWELQQSGLLREIYFRQDRSDAVLMIECADVAEAHRILGSLPLVRKGLITFEVIPLMPYPGLARLFASAE